MNIKSKIAFLLVLISAIPLSANSKKKGSERGILEKMEAVPCGAKQTGLAGLGSLWASVGVTHINSNEKLCPQYLLRTDEMDYQIRPIDLKHATILPIGKEGEFKIKKNEMILSMTEGSDQKARSYEVVSMDPTNSDNNDPKSSSASGDGRRTPSCQNAPTAVPSGKDQAANRPPQIPGERYLSTDFHE
jgi:hypothetical protein